MSDDGWTLELRRRWDEGIVRYPDPAVGGFGSALRGLQAGECGRRAAVYGGSLGGRAGVVWRFRVAGVQRYTEQPDAALLRGDR